MMQKEYSGARHYQFKYKLTGSKNANQLYKKSYNTEKAALYHVQEQIQ